MEVTSPKLQEWKTRSEAVIVLEQDGVLEARAVSYSSRNNYEIELSNIVSIIAVESYVEAVRISQLYNRMVNRGIKIKNLQKVVQAVEMLGSRTKNSYKNGYNSNTDEVWKSSGTLRRNNGVVYELWHPEHGEIKETLSELCKRYSRFSDHIQELVKGKRKQINGYVLLKK